MSLKVKVDNSALINLSSQLKKLSKDLNVKALANSPKIKEVVANAAAEQFKTQGARGGTRWQKLAPATILYKRRRRYSEPETPNVATGATRDAVSNPNNIQVRAIGTTKIEITFSNAPIAGFLQKKRPISVLTQSDVEKIAEEQLKLINKAILKTISGKS